MYVDVACCYRPSSVVCWSVCRSVCHIREPCKTAEPIEMPFGLWTWMVSRNHVVDGSSSPIRRGKMGQERAILRRERAAR